VVCLAPRVPGESVGPRRLSGAVGRSLNFIVRRQRWRERHVRRFGSAGAHACIRVYECLDCSVAKR
jgi:hypothetical protein